MLGKSKWSAAWFYYILIALKLAYNRNKLLKTLDYWSWDMLNFNFLEKGLGIVSPADFAHDFSAKIFLILYSINWLNFSFWLPLLLEILDNMWLELSVTHIFLIEPFFIHNQSHDKNLNILRLKRVFKVK